MPLRTYYKLSLAAPVVLALLCAGWTELGRWLGLPHAFYLLAQFVADIHLFGVLPYLVFVGLMWRLISTTKQQRLDLHLWLSPFYFTGVLLATILLLAGLSGNVAPTVTTLSTLPMFALVALIVGYGYVFMIYTGRFFLVPKNGETS